MVLAFPGRDDVAGLAFVVVLFCRAASPSAGVGNPFSDEEILPGPDNLLHVVQRLQHPPGDAVGGGSVAAVPCLLVAAEVAVEDALEPLHREVGEIEAVGFTFASGEKKQPYDFTEIVDVFIHPGVLVHPGPAVGLGPHQVGLPLFHDRVVNPLDAVGYDPPGLFRLGRTYARADAGHHLYPRIDIPGGIPGLVEDEFVDIGIGTETFKGGADAVEAASAVPERSFQPAVDVFDTSVHHGLASEIAEVAPDERDVVESFRAPPDLFVLAAVVQKDLLFLRDGGKVGFDPFGGPVFPAIVEQPCHLEPYRFGIGFDETVVNLPADPGKILFIPARRGHFVEDVDSIDVVGTVQLRLGRDEFFLDFEEEVAHRVEQRAGAFLVEMLPGSQFTDRCVREYLCQPQGYAVYVSVEG